MNRYPSIIAIALATVTASMFGLVLIPNRQMQAFKPIQAVAPDGSAFVYPRPLNAWREAPGREQYRGLGCIYCHSQQVRPERFGVDLERGWGQRRSVPLDYVLQTPPLTGTMRTGPDLSNISVRQPSADWHYLHLFDPRITSKGSVMPSFKFMFSISQDETRPTADAIEVPPGSAGSVSWIIPSEEAQQLVAYLLTLDQELTLDEVR